MIAQLVANKPPAFLYKNLDKSEQEKNFFQIFGYTAQQREI